MGGFFLAETIFYEFEEFRNNCKMIQIFILNGKYSRKRSIFEYRKKTFLAFLFPRWCLLALQIQVNWLAARWPAEMKFYVPIKHNGP